jgi:non-specific serine/threonine protein kinase
MLAQSHGPLAETAAALGSPDAAAILERAEALIDQHVQELARPQLLRARGRLLERTGDLAAAAVAYDASAAVARAHGSVVERGRTLRYLEEVQARLGDADGVSQTQAERAAIAERLGPQAQHLPWVGRAAAPAPPPEPGPPHSPTTDDRLAPLTARERQVAALVVEGLTNREIAERLCISDRTAGNHVDHILSKLGFRSRVQVAAWFVDHGAAQRSTSA